MMQLHSRRKLIGTVGKALFAGTVFDWIMAQAQTLQSSVQRPSFEVASIRPNHSGDRNVTDMFQPLPGGRFTATNCSLRFLIQYAYDLMPFQVSGGPDWVKSDRFDVNAKAVNGDPQAQELRLMLQGMLEDRFELKYHWDTKEAPVYDLVVTKTRKLRDAEPAECPPGGVPNDAPCGGLRNSPGHTKGYKLTANELAGGLSYLLGRPVLDKTNLTGKYDVELEWTPDSVEMRSSASPEERPATIFTAIQEQLGLKLDPAKGQVQEFVIDHTARPSDN